ncbi:MAG: hypothetical protein JNN20_06760 [Betaproteobacteria bacterium]|nr:hypothetical protein [Betaproteobacteria bacterium]
MQELAGILRDEVLIADWWGRNIAGSNSSTGAVFGALLAGEARGCWGLVFALCETFKTPSFPRRRESKFVDISPHCKEAWIPACAGMTVFLSCACVFGTSPQLSNAKVRASPTQKVPAMPSRPFAFAALAALLIAAPASASEKEKSAERPLIYKSPVLRVVMLEKLYRVNDRQFDRLADIMKYLRDKEPVQFYIDVCQITREEDVSVFHREVQRTYSGPVYVRRLGKNALECSWNSSKPPPRST